MVKVLVVVERWVPNCDFLNLDNGNDVSMVIMVMVELRLLLVVIILVFH